METLYSVYFTSPGYDRELVAVFRNLIIFNAMKDSLTDSAAALGQKIEFFETSTPDYKEGELEAALDDESFSDTWTITDIIDRYYDRFDGCAAIFHMTLEDAKGIALAIVRNLDANSGITYDTLDAETDNWVEMRAVALREALETKLRKLFLECRISEIVPDIYSITITDEPTPRISVVFDDAGMGLFIAGYIAASVHEKFKQIVEEEIGHEILDTDGNVLILNPETEK